MGKLDHGACRENEMLFSAVVLLQCWSIPEIYFWDLITVLTWELGFPCVFFTWDFDLLEIHLLVCDLPEASWYTWDVTYLGFIYLCLWFTWGFLIYLRLEILEVHLPVFVIYLRLLDILETWITWGSVTCVSHLPETFWFTWDLNDLRFSYLCESLTWDFLVYLRFEWFEIHLYLCFTSIHTYSNDIYFELMNIFVFQKRKSSWVTWVNFVLCLQTRLILSR